MPPLSRASDSLSLEPVAESSEDPSGVNDCCGATSWCSSTSVAAQPGAAAASCADGGDTMRRFESTMQVKVRVGLALAEAEA